MSAKLELMWDVLIDRVYLTEDRWQSYPYPMTHEPRISNALREKTIDGTVLAFRLFTDSIREKNNKTNPWRYISLYMLLCCPSCYDLVDITC